MASTSHIVDLTSDGQDSDAITARTLVLGPRPPLLPLKERKRIEKASISPPHGGLQNEILPLTQGNKSVTKKDNVNRTHATSKDRTITWRPLMTPLATIRTPNAQANLPRAKTTTAKKEKVDVNIGTGKGDTGTAKPSLDAQQTIARRTSDLALQSHALESKRRLAKRTSDIALRKLEEERAALPPRRSTELLPTSLKRPSLVSSESSDSGRSNSSQLRDRALTSSETSIESETSEGLLKQFQARPRPCSQNAVPRKLPNTASSSLRFPGTDTVSRDITMPTVPRTTTQTIKKATSLVSSLQGNPRKRGLEESTEGEPGRAAKKLDSGIYRRSLRVAESDALDTDDARETVESNSAGSSFNRRDSTSAAPGSRDSTAHPTTRQRVAFTRSEDLEIIRLKEELQLSWPEIQQTSFRTRKVKTVRSRYMNHLKDKDRRVQTLNRTSLRLPRTGSKFAANSTRFTESPEVPYAVISDEDDNVEELDLESPTGQLEVEDFQPVRRRRAEKKSSILTSSNLIIAPQISSGSRCTRPQSLPSANESTGPRSVPYLSSTERQCLEKCMRNALWDEHQVLWNNCVVHSDFSSEELDVLERVIAKTLPNKRKSRSSSQIRRMSSRLKHVSEDVIKSIAWKARKDKHLRSRDLRSIESFLLDVLTGYVNVEPMAVHLSTNTLSTSASRIGTYLSQRQIGHVGARSGRPRSRFPPNKIRNLVFDSFGKTLSFTGMSHDVNAVAWDPLGDKFAAGSVCTTDASSMQYNRSKNLLFGSVSQRSLRELPDHYTLRQRPENGLNSTHAMHTTQDPRLFSTISAVDFSPSGKWLYSTGYDNYFRVWDASVTDEENPCVLAIQHKDIIDLMSVSPNENVIATATHRRSGSAIKVLRHADDPLNGSVESKWSFGSPRAVEKADLEIYPSSLKFEPNFGRLLLGGFNSSSRDNEEGPSSGEVCLWDVQTGATMKVHAGARNCFDCSWSSLHQGRFAVGHVAGQNVNKGCRTEVRIYDYNQSTDSWGWMLELENTARDINDVVFCPYDNNYVAAGCTDATVYVWDLRRPDQFLYRLQHHESIMPLDHDLPREMSDVGVRFLSWGSSRNRLYSGSSDGIVRAWDITQSREDVYVKDIASLKSGIMCGSFSPDKSSLLLGEVNGSISILEVGKEDYTEDDVASFRVLEVPVESSHEEPDAESGIAAANTLLTNNEIVLRPLGSLPIRQAVQGPNYTRKGPINPADEAAASEFQERMAKGAHTQCEIPACRESAVRTTDEESGDSGRSKDRIPMALRSTQQKEHSQSLRSGFATCSLCGSTARPRANAEQSAPIDDLDKPEILCECCDFSCFRCGQPAAVSNEADTVWCLKCDIEWSIDALGYSVQRKRKDAAKMAIDRDTPVRGPRGKTEVEKQDEEEDVANYYHSLWTNRPPSPL